MTRPGTATRPPSRRQILGDVARAGAAAAVAAVNLPAFAAVTANAAAGIADRPAIVDTHQHLWDLNRLRLPWLDGAGPALNRDFLTADYLEATAGLNVTRAVYMEVAVAPAQRQAEAEYLIDLCRGGGTPTVAAVVGGSPASPDFTRYIKPFGKVPYIKGVRESLARGSADDQAFLAGLRLLGELGMGFDLLAGADLLAEAAAVAKRCPATQFVLDHCGNADARDFRPDVTAEARRRAGRWKDGIAALADCDNVVCKISGVLEAAAPDKLSTDDLAAVIDPCIDRFGPDRVVFAGNWPVVNRGGSFREWVAALENITRARPAAERRKLMSENALRIYRLA